MKGVIDKNNNVKSNVSININTLNSIFWLYR